MSKPKLIEHSVGEKPIEYWRERWRLIKEEPGPLVVPSVVLESGDGLIAALEADLEKALGVVSMLEHHWISPVEYYEHNGELFQNLADKNLELVILRERLRQIGVLATRKNQGSTLAKDLLLDLNKIATIVAWAEEKV